MIGRQSERTLLNEKLTNKRAELVAIIGRRRVGKTFLIREHYKKQIVFEFTGTQYADKENQLQKFADKLSEFTKNQISLAIPEDWATAFRQLKAYIQSIRKSKHKPVVFFDELPWIDSPRSGFLNEFAYWWNDWASHQNMVVVICGSAASWMIDRIVNNKGGLHNRITEYIHLKPFTLAEAKQYVHSVNPALDNYQLVQLYMSVGGIPHYLQHLQKGESATQTINRLCFQKDGILRNEFNNLYAALYEGHERHVSVVKALSTKWKGLTRMEISRLTGLSNGGGLTQILTELTTASFIMPILPFGKKKKDTLYRLMDEYSLFYMTFIEGKRAGKKEIWLQTSREQFYKIWRGYAFENICIKHATAIKKALGISGMLTEVSSYRNHTKKEGEGLQIDMLIDRADQCINLCEMKFYNDEISLTKEDAQALRRRRTRFIQLSKTRKTVFNTLMTTYGINQNQYSLGQVDYHITMDALFLLKSFA